MNDVKKQTRKDIMDYLISNNILWFGKLEPQNFLERIFDLKSLPSYDSRYENFIGDLWQHTINNDDWEADWIFTDDRINLIGCDDSIFLKFLCETIHPIVRDKDKAEELLLIFNDSLKEDNIELFKKSSLYNRPVFGFRIKNNSNSTLVKRHSEIREKLSTKYVNSQIAQMEENIENHPYIAIGIAKELIETCCKSILLEKNLPCEVSWDLVKLFKETRKSLKLTPEDIPDEQKASVIIKSILGSLTTGVQGICELRNSYGSGHGKDSKFKGLGARHAKLAVGLSSTLAIFLLETHEIR